MVAPPPPSLQSQSQSQPSTVPPPAPAPAPLPTTTNTHSTRVDVINTKDGGRILCVADIRGSISLLNRLASEHNASAILHSGDFGFYEPSSIPSISDRTLRHLIQYSSLLTSQTRSSLLAPQNTPQQVRAQFQSLPEFGLSEFPKLLTGEVRLNVPVYTVWGACEDVAILEKIRTAKDAPISLNGPAPVGSTSYGSYSIPNLTVLDEATTRVLDLGGVRLRLFGLGGAVVSHKLFDNGTGNATIAGGGGTMWTTVLQIGELVDTAQKVYDPSETRLLLSHASPGREGLLAQLALVLKADLTLSAGLHFRYSISYNDFSVLHDSEAFRSKLEAAKRAFGDVWDTVKGQVEGVIDENQKKLLENALAVANRVPAVNSGGGVAVEEASWKNCWNWNMPDTAYGSLVLDVRDGKVGSEMKSQGFNFAYRQQQNRSAPPPASASAAAPLPSAPSASTPTPARAPPSTSTPAPSGVPHQLPVPAPTPANFSNANSAPLGQQQQQQQQQQGQAAQHRRAPTGPNAHNGNAHNGFGNRGRAPHQQLQGQQGVVGPRGGFQGPRGGWTAERPPSAASGKKPTLASTAEGTTNNSNEKPTGSTSATSTPAAAAGGATPAATTSGEAVAKPQAAADTPSTSTPKPDQPPRERPNSNRGPRRGPSVSGTSAGVDSGAESSAGENVRSPGVGGTPEGFSGRGRGGGRGMGGGRGGSGDFVPRGRGRGNRGGPRGEGAVGGESAGESATSAAPSSAPAAGSASGAGATSAPATPAAENGGSAGRKAGANVTVGGCYYVLVPHETTPHKKSIHEELDDPEVQCAQVRHWEKLYRQREEIEDRHEAEHRAELDKLDQDHPGFKEHRRECEEKRKRDKEHEIKLMTDRHNESFPSMGGKTKSWSEQKKDMAKKQAQSDEEMKKLKDRLVKAGLY